MKADWAFGSGAQAVTYVSHADEDAYLEHGLSYYRRAGKLALTPGHSDAGGQRYRTFAPDAAILRCFSCHSTGALRISAERAIQPFETGVRCEACHGPGSEHAAAPSKGNIRNLRGMSGGQMNEQCGACHRMPPAAGAATNWNNPWNVRHQPVYLAQSRCFVASKGKLSCSTCHAAHTADVRAQCASCHAKVRHRIAVGSKSCESCHMPPVEPGPHLRFTNHWIGVYKLPSDPLRPLAQRPRLGLAPTLVEK